MKREEPGNCALCPDKACHHGKDCWGRHDKFLERYRDGEDNKFLRVASTIEAEGYCSMNRLQELLRFCNDMSFNRLGVTFCVGLTSEAEIFVNIVSQPYTVVSVCCKIWALDKQDLGLPQIQSGNREFACNPLGQVELLNEPETDYNPLMIS